MTDEPVPPPGLRGLEKTLADVTRAPDGTEEVRALYEEKYALGNSGALGKHVRRFEHFLECGCAFARSKHLRCPSCGVLMCDNPSHHRTCGRCGQSFCLKDCVGARDAEGVPPFYCVVECYELVFPPSMWRRMWRFLFGERRR